MESVSSSFLFKNLERGIDMNIVMCILALIVIALKHWQMTDIDKRLDQLSVVVWYLMEKERKNNDDDE